MKRLRMNNTYYYITIHCLFVIIIKIIIIIRLNVMAKGEYEYFAILKDYVNIYILR